VRKLNKIDFGSKNNYRAESSRNQAGIGGQKRITFNVLVDLDLIEDDDDDGNEDEGEKGILRLEPSKQVNRT